MKTERLKEKVLTAWNLQLVKYAKGPNLRVGYCDSGYCHLCKVFENCRDGCPLYIFDTTSCTNQKTYCLLLRYVSVNCDANYRLTSITPELTAAMALRHRFYVEGLKILESLPESRFESSEGFPELAALDKKLYEEFANVSK